jgi:hypothetical protein
MTVTSAQYNQGLDGNNSSIQAVIDGENWSVPINSDNRHYQAIQEWVAEGNTIAEAE